MRVCSPLRCRASRAISDRRSPRRRGRAAAADSRVGEQAVAVAEGAEAAGDGYPVPLISGCWLSRLERCVHIAEVAGSNPAQPTGLRSIVTMFPCEPSTLPSGGCLGSSRSCTSTSGPEPGPVVFARYIVGGSVPLCPWYAYRARSSRLGTALSIAAPL